MSKVVDVQCGFDYAPSTALNAQMSLRYVLAAALVDGQVLPQQFSEERMHDPQLAAIAASLDLVDDPALDKLYPAHFAGWVAARVNDEWMRVDILDPSGSVAQPLDASGIIDKFRGINPQLPTERIAEVALDMEHHSARELIDLLNTAPAARAAA
jgi:2-methylcitrate dehydratase PrpD